MRQIGTVLYMTLDGVVQSPGRPDEDTRDGFDRGGWATSLMDDVIATESGQGMDSNPELVFGRRTYEDFAGFWPHQTDNPFTGFLDAAIKHVVSRNAATPLPWQNSNLLAGDAAETLGAMRSSDGPDLMIMGSVGLVRSLQGTGLIDTYTLFIAPLVFGRGQRLFTEGSPELSLELTSSVVSTTGVTMNNYRTR